MFEQSIEKITFCYVGQMEHQLLATIGDLIINAILLLYLRLFFVHMYYYLI